MSDKFTEEDIRVSSWVNTDKLTELFGLQVRHNGEWQHVIKEGRLFLAGCVGEALFERHEMLERAALAEAKA